MKQIMKRRNGRLTTWTYAEDGPETKTVTFTLDQRAFAFWSVKIHDWFVETGVFDIQICRQGQNR